MTNPKILVVDDDVKTTALIRIYLEKDGYRVIVAYDGRQALELARQKGPDLVVLDVMLPELDGLEVCRSLRAGSRVPLILLTARTTEEDKLLGLELGADDYVTKPFSPRELLARTRGRGHGGERIVFWRAGRASAEPSSPRGWASGGLDAQRVQSPGGPAERCRTCL